MQDHLAAGGVEDPDDSDLIANNQILLVGDHLGDWYLICTGNLVERSISNVPDGKITTLETCGQNIIWEHAKSVYCGLELFLVNWRKDILLLVNYPCLYEAVFTA